MSSPPARTSDIRAHRIRAILASTVGTTIEWYDFFLYGTAAALVFPKVFFPGSSPFTGIMLSFGTQFVGFAARPIGAAIFGHYGDRIGRKATLIATLLLMGTATALMGVLPTLRGDRPGRPDPAHPAARAAGHRRRRRVGWLGGAVHGVGLAAPPRLRGQLAAGRRAHRAAAVHRHGQAG